jgi:Uma2 family endonuclease
MPPGEDDLPCDDGVPMETPQHRNQMNLLINTLERAWMDRQDFFAGGNMFVYYSLEQVKKNDFRGPDVFVVLNTNRRVRKSWVVWEENGRTPDVVIELLSVTTEAVDRGEKMRIYAQDLHVAEYYLFDPLSCVLEGYSLDPATATYERMDSLPGGDLPCHRLGLRLGVRSGTFMGVTTDWLRWMDSRGAVLPSDAEIARSTEGLLRASEERARAVEERARASEEQARLLAEKLAAYEKRFGPLPE